MPHLEEQFPPVNPLPLQRPDALRPPNPQEDREEDEQSRPVENRVEDEAPQPGSLANGIDRVTISANARVIQPVQPGAETIPVPIELIPGAIQVNPDVPELLDAETQQRNVGNPDPTAIEIPAGTGLQNFNNGLETNPIARNAGQEPNEEVASRIENRFDFVIDQPPGPVVTPLARNTGAENNAAPDIQNLIAPDTPAARGPALRGQIEPRILNPGEEPEPPEQNTLGLRGTTPEARTEGRVNVEIPAALQVDPVFPNIQETRNFGEGRALTLDQDSSGNDDAAIAINTIDEALAEGGALPIPETGEILQPELLIAPAVQPGFIADPDPIEESAPEDADRFTLEDTAPPTGPIEPPEPTGDIEPELQNDEAAPPLLPDPREFDTQREPVIEPGPEPEAPEAVVSSLLDTRQVLEESQEFQELQPPAFPELDNNEPFIPELEPQAPQDETPVVAPAPAVVPPPALDDVPPVAEPEPGNVQALNENPQALRGNNLGTDPALRGSREIRNFLQQFNERIEPPEEVTEPEGAPVAEVQNNAPPPPAVFENLEALSAELLNNLREDQAAEDGVTRPEEERTAPPPPRTPETQLTERGQNIDRFI